MKKLIIIALAALTFTATTASAQFAEDSHVKIMKTNVPGIIKLHYALENTDPLVVKFLTDDGVIQTDRITGIFPTGLSKKYDVRKIKGDFWMEVASSKYTLRYRMVRSRSGQSFTPYLEQTTYNQLLVKAND